MVVDGPKGTGYQLSAMAMNGMDQSASITIWAASWRWNDAG
jgi:hypothetical protein